MGGKVLWQTLSQKTIWLAKLSEKNTLPTLEEDAWTHSPFQKEPPYGTCAEKEWISSNLNSLYPRKWEEDPDMDGQHS